MENWEVPTELNNVSVDVLKLALEQSEIRLKDLETTNVNLTARVQNVLTLLIGIVVAAVGYLFSNSMTNAPIMILAVSTCVYGFVLCAYLLKGAYSGEYIPSGAMPSILLSKEVLAHDWDTIKNLYINLLAKADVSIIDYRIENDRRWRVLKRTTTAAIYMPIVLVILYLASRYAGHLLDLWFLSVRQGSL